MGQVYPKNYPVAEVISVFADPGQDFATIKARPLAQMASTRNVLLVFPDQPSVIKVEVGESASDDQAAQIEPVQAAKQENL